MTQVFSGSAGILPVYASVGRRLVHYDLDVAQATLVPRESVELPAKVQYAWPHASKQYLYVAAGNGGRGIAGDTFRACAFRIDAASGALRAHGESVALPARPIHLTTDTDSRHVLIAYSDSIGLTVHRINADGTIGRVVDQPASLDLGIFPHQVRVAPSGKSVILVTRGNDATDATPEDPGALKVFAYSNGVLANKASIAPGRGYGFGPRHVDFHPSQRWLFVSLERQNKLYVHTLTADMPGATPSFMAETLIDPHHLRPRQIAGTVHVHPNGRFVYVVNRAYEFEMSDGKRIFCGGENNIAVYAINQQTGQPTLLQHIDTRGIYARTFSIDPGGRLLIAANLMPLLARDGAALSMVPASLSIFRIGGDGRLDYARKYDIAVGDEHMFWMGIIGINP